MADRKPTIYTTIEDDIATVVMGRADKRNAINDSLVDELDQFFGNPPDGVTV